MDSSRPAPELDVPGHRLAQLEGEVDGDDSDSDLDSDDGEGLLRDVVFVPENSGLAAVNTQAVRRVYYKLDYF